MQMDCFSLLCYDARTDFTMLLHNIGDLEKYTNSMYACIKCRYKMIIFKNKQ